jgi:hypothetical protein
MNIHDLIDDLLIELSYQTKSGIPDLKNRETIGLIYEYFDIMGMPEIGQEIVQNLLSEAPEEKAFKNPKLNQVVKYKDKEGNDKEGILGNLLRLKTDQPGREAAERALGNISDEERQVLNKELGGEGGGGEQPDQQSGGGQGQPQVQQGTALNPDTEAGKDFTDQLSPTDPAYTGKKDVEKTNQEKSSVEPFDGGDKQGDIAKTDSGKTLYSLGNGYYSDTPNGTPKFIRTESVNEIQAKNQKGQTIQVEPISSSDVEKAEEEYRTSNFPNFREHSAEDIVDYLIKGEYKPTSDSDFDEVRKDSRGDASTGQNAGAGGDSTTAQEEAAGLGAEIALKNPDFTNEQIQEELVKQLLQWPFYNGNEKEARRIAKVSMGQVAVLRDIQESENYGEQKDGYPKPITFTKKITIATANYLATKLKEAKERGDEEEIKHWEEQLRDFAEYATEATGKVGDADTAIMYLDKNGRVRIGYVTNKMSLGDMKVNTTKNARAKNFIKNAVEGANVEELRTINSITTGQIKQMNEAAVEKLSFIRENLTLTKDRKNIPGSVLDSLFPRSTFEGSDKYKKDLAKNPLVIEHLRNKFNKTPETATNEELLEAAFEVIGEKGADGLGSNKKGGAGKALVKIGNLWNDLDSKVQQQKNKGVEGDQIYKNIADITDKTTGNRLYGGGMTWEELKQLHENKTAEKLASIADSRGDSMREAHANVVNDCKSVDMKYFMEQGMSQQEAEERVNSNDAENGPNVETYVRTFMDEMHWTRIIRGKADGKVFMSIGQYSVKPEHYRECLKDLTGYEGDVDTPEGREGLIDHLAKFCKVTPGQSSVKFINYKTGEEVTLGEDTWRTAGDNEKLEGKDGKDLQKCLESKQK